MKKKKSSIVFWVVFLTFAALIVIFKDQIGLFVYEKFVIGDIKITEFEPNEYYRPNNYSYVQITDDFVAKDEKHLLNIYYTIINSGIDSFTFRCDKDYTSCLDDVDTLSNSQSVLSNINSFVHPYNSFSSVETQYDTLGKVVIKVNKSYSEEEITAINNEVKKVIDAKGSSIIDTRDLIKTFHDYIINKTKYDSNRSDRKIVDYKSDIAYGPLIEGYGLCGGYTDAMALFLDYYDIPNFKVISENHIWNAVKIDGKWYHLDLTWDDPISKSGKDILEYTFFLIKTEKLLQLEKEQHIFDQNIFKEVVW